MVDRPQTASPNVTSTDPRIVFGAENSRSSYDDNVKNPTNSNIMPWYYKLVFGISFLEVVLTFSYSILFMMATGNWPSYQAGREFYSSIEISSHAVAAVSWMIIVLGQITLGSYARRTGGLVRRVHRYVGYGLLITMVFFVMPSSIWASIINPNGHNDYIIFNAIYFLLLGAIAQVIAVMAARSRNFGHHVDSILICFVTITSAGTLRVITFAGYAIAEYGITYLATGTVLWLAILIKCLVPIYCQGRIRENRLLASLLVVGLLIAVVVGTINSLQAGQPISFFELPPE